ncbi:1-acyl-sn-glycerol-3-phosphate acyltransferase [Congregibacter brevis]|uniref:1-acyl-sn-glycerol-3-phosphate acyltransferase n=1 Tax=Congregibacter brevis TaxID=3081201 RepID=A0ABZ0IHW8_9GAMM|nr:1-acyl-sn-glycerol-3-phosphate acyltransferase [Congregibacter sp. IMCC45268]
MPDPFAAIRPYNDGEVRPTIDRLLGSTDFLNAMLRLRFGEWALLPLWSWLLRPLARLYLRRQLARVDSVHDLQMLVKTYVERMIEDTTTGLTVSGLEHLDPAHAHLFISNHRDIALDPALTNYALHRAGYETLRIAIGDNLLSEQWVADLMRLNKSFVVLRSVSGPRELLANSKLLAQYIRKSIQKDNAPIWIAQREGRAKDGRDRTEAAVIKMLSLSRDKKHESFGDHIASLRIVPVAISYELDPCDAMKARELSERESTGSYEKSDQEDVESIGQGIAGNKGRVHVKFGTPLGSNFETPADVAAAIDAQIVHGYLLRPVNLWAFESLEGPLERNVKIGEGSISRAEFEDRVRALSEEERPFALAAYANALRSVLELDTPS